MRSHLGVAFALLLVFTFGQPAALVSATDPSLDVTLFSGPGIDSPAGIVSGPDGAIWYANSNGSIARMGTDGTVLNTYSVAASPTWLTVGPDGALWFDADYSIIGRVTTAGAVSIWTGSGISCPRGISAGPDGNVWFASYCNGYIGRITPAGVITLFGDPGLPGHTDPANRFSPIDIVTGSDDALWFTNYDGSWIGRIASDGTMTAYDHPSINWPVNIVVGPDQALWFSNRGSPNEGFTNQSIGRITTAGAVSSYTNAAIDIPGPLTIGPDGALWFVNSGNDSIGRVTTDGVVTIYPVSGIDYPWGITTGPDGNVWFTSGASSKVGRITLSAPFPFGGFMSPVDSQPTLNAMKAGAAVPIKFSLGGDEGLAVLALGSPTSQRIACDGNAPLDSVETTATAGTSGLQYDAATGLYTYVWKTHKAWVGSCRVLTLELVDGSIHQANFLFK